MNTRPLTLFAVALLLAQVVAAADESPATTQPAVAAKDTAKSVPGKVPAACPSTGSRIRSTGTHCPAAGMTRSYDQKDLQSTGETDVGAALKKLDPIFH